MVKLIEGPARGLTVAVVGGSIAGCAMAIELLRAGCDVTLFERTGEELKERGAGISVPPSVFEMLVQRDLVDPGLPCVPADRALFLWKSEGGPPQGQVAWEQASVHRFLNWGALYLNLRKRLPDEVYRAGQRVAALHQRPAGTVGVELADGSVRDFELVVCADGPRSLGRRTLFPELGPESAGYMLWRGALTERAAGDSGPLEGVVSVPGFPGGSARFSLVPEAGGSIEPGARLVSWMFYLQTSGPASSPADPGDRGRPGSLLPGIVRGPLEAWLKAKAREVLPRYHATIIEKSLGTSLHAVLDCTVPAYRKGRLGLAGDAGALARPHGASGALKSVHDAVTLGTALAGSPTVEDALALWDASRTAMGNRLVRFGRQLGEALVTAIPDWSGMDAARMESWFKSVVTVESETFGVADPDA